MKFIPNLRVSCKQATWKIEAQINRNASLGLRTAEFKLYWNGSTGVGVVDFCDVSFCVPWYRTSPISKRPFIVNISSGFFVYSLLALHMIGFSVTISHIVVLFFFCLIVPLILSLSPSSSSLSFVMFLFRFSETLTYHLLAGRNSYGKHVVCIAQV